MKYVDVLALNAQDALGDPERADKAVGWIRRLKPDAAFLSEAFSLPDGWNDQLEASLDAFEELGYQILAADNGDVDGRNDRHGFVALGPAGSSMEMVDLGTRRGALTQMLFPGTSYPLVLHGRHGNDRSEDLRLAERVQLDALRRSIGSHAMARTVQGCPWLEIEYGDLNTAPHDSRAARFVRWLKPLGDWLPEREPKKGDLHPGRLGNILRKLDEVTDGSVLDVSEASGLRDADPWHRPTFPAKAPLFQLDHIMVSQDLQVEWLDVRDTRGLSDHNLVLGRLSLAPHVGAEADYAAA